MITPSLPRRDFAIISMMASPREGRVRSERPEPFHRMALGRLDRRLSSLPMSPAALRAWKSPGEGERRPISKPLNHREARILCRFPEPLSLMRRASNARMGRPSTSSVNTREKAALIFFALDQTVRSFSRTTTGTRATRAQRRRLVVQLIQSIELNSKARRYFVFPERCSQSFTYLSNDCTAERPVDINLVSHTEPPSAKTRQSAAPAGARTNGAAERLFTKILPVAAHLFSRYCARDYRNAPRWFAQVKILRGMGRAVLSSTGALNCRTISSALCGGD
jgi:hypothetical protein